MSYQGFKAFGRDAPYFERVREIRTAREEYFAQLPKTITAAVDEVWTTWAGKPLYDLYDIEVTLEASEEYLALVQEIDLDSPENADQLSRAFRRADALAREFKYTDPAAYMPPESAIGLAGYAVTPILYDTWVMQSMDKMRAAA